MLYLVEASATIEPGNAIDGGDGPAPFFTYIAERFNVQAMYSNPTRRGGYLIVELESPAKIAELMYALTWFLGREPTFNPVMPIEVYGEAMENAKQAPCVGEILSKAAGS